MAPRRRGKRLPLHLISFYVVSPLEQAFYTSFQELKMSGRNFRKLIEARWAANKFVCVGLDSEYVKIPEFLSVDSVNVENTLVGFNCTIINATDDLVCAFKLNIAFYEAWGDEGLRALKRTIAHIQRIAPDVPVILDFKRADIGNTNTGYVQLAFEYLKADAITVHPYLGGEALQPFLDCKDKGIFVLCRTSNPGAGELQDITVPVSGDEVEHFTKAQVQMGWNVVSGMNTDLYLHLGYQVSKHWNKNGNCGVVVGATYPEELDRVRRIVGDMPILIPGIGAQGGDLEKTISAGKDSRSKGMIINSSRGIIFASDDTDFAEAARRETEKLHDAINLQLWSTNEPK